MRGGAIPLLAWGTLLLVLYIINWIWDAHAMNAAASGVAVVIIFTIGISLWLARRDSLRRGPPEPSSKPEPLPGESLAAALAGLAIGSILFGLVWGRFLVVFGVGLLVASVGRGVLEWRAERRSLERAAEKDAR